MLIFKFFLFQVLVSADIQVFLSSRFQRVSIFKFFLVKVLVSVDIQVFLSLLF